MEKPTLQDIANMPFPESEQALQRFYGVEPYRERYGDTGKWRVDVEYTYSYPAEDLETFEVEAASEDEAKQIARDMCKDEQGHRDDFEIEDVSIVERPQ